MEEDMTQAAERMAVRSGGRPADTFPVDNKPRVAGALRDTLAQKFIAKWGKVGGAVTGVVAALALTPGASAAERPASDANLIPEHYVVVYEDSVGSVSAETDRREGKLGFESKFRYRHAVKGFAAKLNRAQVRAVRSDPDVAYVAEDRTMQASSRVPIVLGDEAPTGTRRIGAATARTAEHASDTGVAVIDTGVDLTHPDLDVSNGTDCIDPGTTADDDQGHGTHVAGSIAAKNNGSGVVGVAPGTKVWAVKVLDSTGNGSLSSIVCGIDWVTANAVSKNIKVLNMSLGGSGEPVQACETTTDPMHQAVCRAAAGDVLSVVAAGNDGWDFDYAASPDVPAAYPQALTVTALSDSDGRSGGTGGAPACRTGEADDAPASFSNFAATSGGAAHTIAAPGTCITSTWPTDVAPSGGYTTISGTSMAAPHIAGAAALCENDGGVAGACAGKTPAEVISSLRATAQSHTTRHPAYGFAYDPAHTPQAGRYFGYLTVVDTAAPDTEIFGGPAGTTNSSSASFSFSSTEESSSFECKLDSGGWESCSSPKVVAGLSDGSHALSVRATDAAGNTDPSAATRSFSVDTADPISPGSTSTPGATPTPATTLPSPDEIANALGADLSVLARDLRRIGIARLVRWRGFKARNLDAAMAGTFSVTLTGTPRGSGIARRVVLAKASRSVSAAGRYTFEVKLTRRGKRLLRRDRRARVALTIKFRDSSGRAITKRKLVKLRR